MILCYILLLSLFNLVASNNKLICHSGVLENLRHVDTIKAVTCPILSPGKYCLSFTSVLKNYQEHNNNIRELPKLQTVVGCETKEINCAVLKGKHFFEANQRGCITTVVNGTSGLLCCCPGRHCNKPHHLQRILKVETNKCNNGTSQKSLENCNSKTKQTLMYSGNPVINDTHSLLESDFCMSIVGQYHKGNNVKVFGCDQAKFCEKNGAAIELLEPQCFKANNTKICCCRGDNCNRPSMYNRDEEMIKIMPQNDNHKIFLPVLIAVTLSGITVSIVLSIIVYKKCRQTTMRENDSMMSICNNQNDVPSM